MRVSKQPSRSFGGQSRSSIADGLRPLAALVVIATGLSACAGGEPDVTRQPELLAESEDVDTVLRIADDLRDQGQLATAIAFYQRAAATSGKAPELIVLGRALVDAGAAEYGAGAYRKALALEPENPDALLGLGTAYLLVGEIDKSIQYLEQLVDQGDGTDTIRYAALGAALDIAGRHEQAVATYTAGLEQMPDDLDLKSNLALSYAFYDRHVEAIELMNEVTNTLGSGRTHHRNLVLILALAGQDRDAVATGRRLLGENETRDVLAQAASVRQLPSGADRARAVGLT